jgi:endonuclease G
MAESFYYSNMSPQEPGFNRGIWSKLEQLVRTWAVDNEAVYVVTGPILEEGLKRIGPDSVAVPKYYYKVILDNRQPSIKGIGFILPNCGSSEPLGNFAVSIDSVEAVTGIDFFYKLPDSCENKVEKSFSMDEWFFGAVKVAKSTSSVQCRGITKAGNRCKNRTLNESGYCNVHSYQYKL